MGERQRRRCWIYLFSDMMNLQMWMVQRQLDIIVLSRLNQVWWPFGQSRGIWNGRMAIEMCENRLAWGGGEVAVSLQAL